MRAILVRHGETLWNKEGRFQGQRDVVGLTQLGLTQAQNIAKALIAMNPTSLFSSPLKRTLETSLTLSHYLDLPIVPIDGLKEIDLGTLEGIKSKKLKVNYPHIFHQWHSDPSKVLFPAGESLPKLQNRAWRAIKIIERLHADETVVVVSHNFTIRTIIYKLLGLPLAKFHMVKLDLCSISIIELANNKNQLISLNEHYLPDLQ